MIEAKKIKSVESLLWEDNQIEIYDGEIKAYNISKFHITKEDGKADYNEFYICKDNVIFLEAYRG